MTGAMSYRADDPEALEALLSEWGAPASLRQALLDSGYSTLGALAFAVLQCLHLLPMLRKPSS